MKTLVHAVLAILMGVVLIGCSATMKEISMMGRSIRTDVFSEVVTAEAPPAGYADLVIKASIKTPLAGYYLFESEDSGHGKPGYPFLINVDGQASLWKVDGREELVPRYDENGKTSRDPDAGKGMVYLLEKKLRLSVGEHTIFFGLPGESYATTVRLTLQEGESSVMEFKPQYRYKTRPTRIPTFLRGIERYEVVVNGKSMT